MARKLLMLGGLTLSLANLGLAQTYVETHGTSDRDFSAAGMAVDFAGNTVMVGRAFDGQSEAVVMKLDPDGNLLWSTTTDSQSGAIRTYNDAEFTPSGDVLVVGYQDIKPVIALFDGQTGDLIYNKTPLELQFNGNFVQVKPTLDGQYIAGGFVNMEVIGAHFLLCKFMENGTITWIRWTGGQFSKDHGLSITPTQDGSFVMAGRSDQLAVQQTDLWVCKFDFGGFLQWQQLIGTTNHDGNRDVEVVESASGDLIVMANRDDDLADSSADSVWILRLDTDGNRLSERIYSLGVNSPSALAATADDGCVFVAETSPDGASANRDLWVVKLNSAGGIEWQTVLGGNAHDRAAAIRQTSSLDYVIAGDSRSFTPDGGGFHDDRMLAIRLNAVGELGCPCPYASDATGSVGLIFNGSTHNSTGQATGIEIAGILTPVIEVESFPSEPSVRCGTSSGHWQSLGNGLGGDLGVPCYSGHGRLEAGSFITTLLNNALPNSVATLGVGTSELNGPFAGGILVPQPTLIVSGLPTGPLGRIELPSSWAPGIPSGFELIVQVLVADPTAPQNVAFSNAIRALVP